MRKWLPALLVSTLLAMPFAGTVNAQARPQWKFVTEPLPPFQVEDSGRAKGPITEIIQAICVEAGIDCEIEILPWRRAYALATGGEVHGVFILLPTPERQQLFHLSPELFETAYSLFVQKASPIQYRQLSDLAGMTIGAYGPSGNSRTAEELTAGMAKTQIEIELSNEFALRKLAAGRYGERGAVFINRDVGNWLIRRDKLDGIRHAGDVKTVRYVFGLSRKKLSEADAETFFAAQRRLARNGKIAAILSRHDMTAVE